GVVAERAQPARQLAEHHVRHEPRLAHAACSAVASYAGSLYPSPAPMVLSLAEGAYRLLNAGLLSRLPEARAVRVGQALLRAMPVEAVPAFRRDDPRLAVQLGGVCLPSPVILSSMYYDLTILRKAMALGFGAVTTKSITLGPRPGHPEPNL